MGINGSSLGVRFSARSEQEAASLDVHCMRWGLGGGGISAGPTVSVFIIAFKENRSSVRSSHGPRDHGTPAAVLARLALVPSQLGWLGQGAGCRAGVTKDTTPEVLQSFEAEARVPARWPQG